MMMSFRQVMKPHMKNSVVSTASGAKYFESLPAVVTVGRATGAGDAKVKAP